VIVLSPLVRRAPYITKLEEDNVRQGFIEQGQYLALRAALPDHLMALLVVGYHCGNRLGELRKLCWSQVDMEAGEIRIEKSQAKSKKPRTLPIHGDMVDWLEWQRRFSKGERCSPGSSQRSGWRRKRRHWAHT
jgi:integrase